MMASERVVVAVKASREISKTALVWALTHVVQPGACITLLAVISPQISGKKLWGFPRFGGDCASGHRHIGTVMEQKCDIAELCSKMMVQLRNVYDPSKVNIKVKIVSGSPCGAVAIESKRIHANWVVLDRQLKNEGKCCMKELYCNIVVMKRSKAKVLRLNLVGSPETDTQRSCSLPSELDKSTSTVDIITVINDPSRDTARGPAVTPTSSPDVETISTTTEVGISSVSSSDPSTSPSLIPEQNVNIKEEEQVTIKEKGISDAASCDAYSESLSPTTADYQPSSKHIDELSHILGENVCVSSVKALQAKFSKLDEEAGISNRHYKSNLKISGNVRERGSVSRHTLPGPPPLCSICQHKAPIFGNPPRRFSYAELELATGGFSMANFLAEGGFGSVHRGVLPDGQAIAVKQHKLASSQGDHEFCSEVEVLSRAQHRNVVMLIGFCTEDSRRLLVYEYICNGSLDSHLYGHDQEALEWSARLKIAVGAARGLRYLHEECRVGCIVHRDMRPNNILITHDFEPLVGDFGLARWQPDGDLAVETRVLGTFGYLAPEYVQSGQITEKTDVYSFGVVLLELVTGRKAVNFNGPKGHQCLTEWARPLLEGNAVSELIDHRLGNRYSEQELCCMLHAASLCIGHDPNARPKMSLVLHILEGNVPMESGYISIPGYDPGNRSNRYGVLVVNQALEGFGCKQSHDALRAAWEKDRQCKSGSF